MPKKKMFVFLGNLREVDAPHLSDAEVAARVKNLKSDDFNHECICVMGRDRILYLSQENKRLRERTMVDQTKVTSTELTDQQVAGKIRMLMRSANDHGDVCKQASERIINLIQVNEKLRALQRKKKINI